MFFVSWKLCVARRRRSRVGLCTAEQPVRVVLDHGDAVAGRDGIDLFHLAGRPLHNARNDGSVRGVIRRFEVLLVEVQRVRRGVGEHRLAPRRTNALTRRNERERGHDHFVAGLDVEQQRRHFQRMRARRGERGPASRPDGLAPRSPVP